MDLGGVPGLTGPFETLIKGSPGSISGVEIWMFRDMATSSLSTITSEIWNMVDR